MKKILMATAVVMGLVSCGNQSADEEATADSTNMTDANQAPMGDTTGMINNNTGNYPTDTSNQNGDDSVTGSSPASRSTTPRNANNNNNGGM
jgi:hypothetical protein